VVVARLVTSEELVEETPLLFKADFGIRVFDVDV
jgi:hypothetical protein